VERGGIEQTLEFLTGRHPFSTVLPLLGVPGILIGEPPKVGFRSPAAVHFYYWPPGFPEALGLAEGESAQVRVRGDINLVTFARAIAKIGYCHAVVHRDVVADPALPIARFIRGLNDHGSYLVGSDPDADPPPPDEAGLLHRVTLRWENLPHKDVLFAVIRLFAHTGTEERGMPTYLVAIDERPIEEPPEPNPAHP
jgi:hypothetical protein